MPRTRVSYTCPLDQPRWATSLLGAGSFGGSDEIIAVIALISFCWAEIYIISLCWHVELLVFGVLLSPLLGTSWVVLGDASPRAAGPTGAEELAAGLWVTPWTAASGPGCLLLPQGL